MIKATMQTSEGKNILLLGLSKENVNKLKLGKPIHVTGSEVGLENDVLLVYGDTEAEIYKELQPLIGTTTRVEPTTPQTIQ